MGNSTWKEVGTVLAKLGLPALGWALGGPGGAEIGAQVASVIGTNPDSPEEAATALQANPEIVVKLREIEADVQKTQITAMVQQAIAERQADSADTSEINQTMRAESVSGNRFQNSWRPFFGYALTGIMIWFTLIFGIAFLWVVFNHIAMLSRFLISVGQLLQDSSWAIGTALAVLGINVKMRSDDKARLLNMEPGGLLNLFKKGS